MSWWYDNAGHVMSRTGTACSLSWARCDDPVPRRRPSETRARQRRRRRRGGQLDWRKDPRCASSASRWRCGVAWAADAAATAWCTARLAGWSSPPPASPAVTASGHSSRARSRASAHPSHRTVSSSSDGVKTTRHDCNPTSAADIHRVSKKLPAVVFLIFISNSPIQVVTTTKT